MRIIVGFIGVTSVTLSSAAACGESPNEGVSAATVDKASRSASYPLKCEHDAEPTLTKIDERTMMLICPGPDGRRLKVVCPKSAVVTRKPTGGYHFACS